MSAAPAQIWYPVDDDQPRPNARVILKWGAHEIEAMRLIVKGAWRWATLDGRSGARADAGSSGRSGASADAVGRRLLLLPPPGEEDRWEAAPIAWRPAVPAFWPDPLPEPIRLSEPGRFVDVRPGRMAKMARQAEEAARIKAEIEADIGPDDDHRPPNSRVGALLGRSRVSANAAVRGSRPERWWQDPVAITYSGPGQVGPAEAEGRVMRAILTDGLRMIERPVGFEGTAAGLAYMVAEHVSADDGERDRFEPTQRDHTDYTIAMAWFAAVAPLEERPKRAPPDWLSGRQRVLVHVALGHSYRLIAKREGGSHEGWRRTYAAALDRVWRAANGRPVADHFTVADQVAAVRERNRAWKRGQG